MTTRLIEVIEPCVTLAQAKRHLRLDDTSEDELVEGYIEAACLKAGAKMNRAAAVCSPAFCTASVVKSS